MGGVLGAWEEEEQGGMIGVGRRQAGVREQGGGAARCERYGGRVWMCVSAILDH